MSQDIRFEDRLTAISADLALSPEIAPEHSPHRLADSWVNVGYAENLGDSADGAELDRTKNYYRSNTPPHSLVSVYRSLSRVGGILVPRVKTVTINQQAQTGLTWEAYYLDRCWMGEIDYLAEHELRFIAEKFQNWDEKQITT